MEHIDILGGAGEEHLEGSKIQEKFGNDLKFECFPSLHPDPLAWVEDLLAQSVWA